MIGTKRVMPSAVLGRPFHFDLFVPSTGSPEFVAVLFGGSGKDREEYERRRTTLIPTFTQVLEQIEEEFRFAFVYYTAPYDIPYATFDEHPEEADRWRRHVAEELVPLLPDGPLFAAAYSGGAVLALPGFADHPRCFGGGMLGADQIPLGWEPPSHWVSPIRLVYNRADRVMDQNQSRLIDLDSKKAVKVVRTPTGGHDLNDYIKNGAFAGMLRFARKDLR